MRSYHITVVIVDEASMLGTPKLKKLLSCATVGRAKMVLVGDAYQLGPVLERGGMFEQMCAHGDSDAGTGQPPCGVVSGACGFRVSVGR